MATDAFKQWCIVELFGHTRVAGLLTEARWPPGFARLEIRGDDKHPATTHFYNPQSFFGLHPVTEEIARKVCENCRPEVVHPWEMPSQPRLPAKAGCDQCGEQDCEGECIEGEEPAEHACVQCGKPVEPEREIYASPTCFACLPHRRRCRNRRPWRHRQRHPIRAASRAAPIRARTAKEREEHLGAAGRARPATAAATICRSDRPVTCLDASHRR